MATSIATRALSPRVAVALVGPTQPGRGVPLAGRRGHDRQRPRRHQGRHADRGGRRPDRRDHLEPGHLAVRHPVEFVARAHRRRDRLDAGRGGRQFGAVARPGLEGRPARPSCRRSSPPGRRGRHLAALPDQPEPDARGPQPRLPDRADRVGLHGVAGSRHQRRAEDDGRHHAGPDRQRHAGGQVERAVLGHPGLRAGHQHRHLPGRLAGHPHPGQGPGGDRVAAGHGGRVLLGRDHLAVGQLRLLAVHHARRHRVDHRHRARQEGRRRPLERGQPDGHRVGVHPALRRARRRRGVRARPRHRRQLPA